MNVILLYYELELYFLKLNYEVELKIFEIINLYILLNIVYYISCRQAFIGFAGTDNIVICEILIVIINK